MKQSSTILTAFVLSNLPLGTSSVSAQDKAQMENLFDGTTLNSWVQLNGTAKYTVEEGAIVGTTSPGSPNSFLCTKKSFGNFILELDFKTDEALNSGIQIRSQSFKEFKDSRVHGYQVEIDPAQKELYSADPANLRADGSIVLAGTEPRRWTGGIYDEGRRGANGSSHAAGTWDGTPVPQYMVVEKSNSN